MSKEFVDQKLQVVRRAQEDIIKSVIENPLGIWGMGHREEVRDLTIIYLQYKISRTWCCHKIADNRPSIMLQMAIEQAKDDNSEENEANVLLKLVSSSDAELKMIPDSIKYEARDIAISYVQKNF